MRILILAAFASTGLFTLGSAYSPAVAFADESRAANNGAANNARPPGCTDPRTTTQLILQQRAGFHLEAHLLAETLVLLCPDAPAQPRWRLANARALFDLDEHARAQALSWEVERDPAASPPDRKAAQLLRAWMHLRQRDSAALTAALSTLPAPDRLRLEALAEATNDHGHAATARLPAPLQARAAAEAAALDDARHTRRPWLAATLSTLLPGSGQLYAGSWQGAAVAFILNAALITATAELAHRHFYFTATAAGLAASFFYIGNILNAADLAHRRNDRASEVHRRRLEEILMPETALDW